VDCIFIPERLGNALYKSTVTLRRFYDSAHRSLLFFRTESVMKRRRHQTPGGACAPCLATPQDVAKSLNVSSE